MAYAEISWQAGDVQSVRESWTLEQCEEWLEENEKHLTNRLTELGFEVISDLLPPELDELPQEEKEKRDAEEERFQRKSNGGKYGEW